MRVHSSGRFLVCLPAFALVIGCAPRAMTGAAASVVRQDVAETACEPGDVAGSSYAAIDHFSSGTIRNRTPAQTPTGRGVFVWNRPWCGGSMPQLAILANYAFALPLHRVSPAATLELSVYHPFAAGASVRAYVDVVDGSRTTRVFEAVVVPGEEPPAMRAVAKSVSLAPFSGRDVELIFGASPAAMDLNAAWCVFDRAAVVSPAKRS
jgi:hypothetical protein